MKKQLLLFLFSCMAVVAAQAQICTPVHDFGEESYGVYPDTTQNLAAATLNQVYFQQIDVKLPQNANDIGLPITIDSATIVSVDGLPAGLTWACGDPDCTYNGGDTGCGVISGTPTVADTFELNINTLLYGYFLGSPVTLPMEFAGYRIIVDGQTGIADPAPIEFALHPMQPNPAQNRATITYSTPAGGEILLVVYDLLGKPVLEKTLAAAPGNNAYELYTGSLQAGLYICTISAAGQSLSRKLTIRR